jgi:hypothetical protein
MYPRSRASPSMLSMWPCKSILHMQVQLFTFFSSCSPIHLSMKEGSLFCFVLYLWDPPNWDASDRVLGVFGGKLLTKIGAWAWFHNIWTCNAKVLEYWMISSLKSTLNRIWKSGRNWNVPLVLLERSWQAGFHRIYLLRFGFHVWEILIFKRFLPLKIQINSPKKSDFGRKIIWGRGNTWANGTGHTSKTKAETATTLDHLDRWNRELQIWAQSGLSMCGIAK